MSSFQQSESTIYADYLMTRLYQLKQGNNSIHHYCLELEYLTNQLTQHKRIIKINQFLFYSFISGIESKYLLLLKFLDVMEYNSAKNICLAVEANI
jgi:hypothetical protein